jgi:hypothetical protein
MMPSTRDEERIRYPMTSEQGPAGREELIEVIREYRKTFTDEAWESISRQGQTPLTRICIKVQAILDREPPKLAACAVCGHDACFTNTGAITCYHQCWTLLQCCERAESRERVIARWNAAQAAMAGVRNTTR